MKNLLVSINVSQVENGYLVNANLDSRSISEYPKVFQSKKELLKYIDLHFTFENEDPLIND